MKSLRTVSVIAALSGLAVATQAQITVLSENFDELPLGAYGTSAAYDLGPSPDVNIVSPGNGGSGNAWEITRTADPSTLDVNFFGTDFGPNTMWIGADTPNMNLTGNTDPNLADYTLSFDLQTSGDALTGDACIVTLYDGTGSGGGVYSFISMPDPGTGYENFSINMGTMSAQFTGTLDPTVSQVYFDVSVFNFTSGAVTGQTVTLDVDNINVSLTQVPEPSTYATLLGGLGLLVGWLRFRRA